MADLGSNFALFIPPLATQPILSTTFDGHIHLGSRFVSNDRHPLILSEATGGGPKESWSG